MLFFRHEEKYVLDSSCIIDGRVVGLFEKRFFEGRIIIPYLVRIIARRKVGPEVDKVINMLKKSAHLEFVDKNVDGMAEEICVLKTASRRKSKLITTSDEVRRYSQSYPDVKIINLRELYRTLTPLFPPNRIIAVRIMKRGHHSSEGIGYIEGVKVVVEDGAKMINHTVNVKVTSMLQFESGNLVFGTLAEKPEHK